MNIYVHKLEYEKACTRMERGQQKLQDLKYPPMLEERLAIERKKAEIELWIQQRKEKLHEEQVENLVSLDVDVKEEYYNQEVDHHCPPTKQTSC